MSETPEQFYERVSGSIRRPKLEEWDTFPFEDDIRPRVLERPAPEDVSRAGQGGIDCGACTTPDDRFLWTNANWRVRPTAEPSGLPLVLFLEPRLHVGEPGDLPNDLASEFGVMISRIDRAIRRSKASSGSTSVDGERARNTFTGGSSPVHLGCCNSRAASPRYGTTCFPRRRRTSGTPTSRT
jgi:hypothetical protein